MVQVLRLITGMLKRIIQDKGNRYTELYENTFSNFCTTLAAKSMFPQVRF